MRKTLTAIIAAFSLLLCAGIASEGVSAWAETPAGSTESFSPDGSVIFEKDGIKITTAGLDQDPTDGDDQPIIWLEIENTGSEDAFLGTSEGSVNGFMTDVLLVSFYEEDGEIYGADYTDCLTVPAGSSGRYALGYYKVTAPGIDTDQPGEIDFRFTMAEDEFTWPDYFSEPVKIVTDLAPKPADILSLGTAVIDTDTLLVVLGEQDYDDWFGPEVCVYVENRADHCIGLYAETATADGHDCDYIYFGKELAPGKRSAGYMSFEGEVRELKSIGNLAVTFSLKEADTIDALNAQKARLLDPVSLEYPPQEWGEYENGGLNLEVKPKYNQLITVGTPENDAEGILFTVSETASAEAGKYEGAGWLFSVGKVSEERLHAMLCEDMSGAQAFAKDSDGNYYIYYHPTDVRLERASQEELEEGIKQWSMLCEWADNVPASLAEKNGLETVSYGNSEVDIFIARAAYMDGINATLSTTEFGPVSIAGVDGAPYAEFVMRGWFMPAEGEETPNGEYVVLNFEDDDARLDFFFAPGGYVRLISRDRTTLYQAMWTDDSESFAEAMQEWYYAAIEKAGIAETA